MSSLALPIILIFVCLCDLGFAATSRSSCFHSTVTLKEILQNHPTIEGYPWEISIKGALLSHRSHQQARYKEPTVQILGDDGKAFFPLSKVEPVVDHVHLFSFASVTAGAFDYYPKPQGRYKNIDFPHPKPHPSIMDHYRHQALTQIRESYRKQKIPWKAWQSIETDEFGLAQHRSFQVAIAQNKKLRAYGRLYIGSKALAAETELFGDKVQYVQTESLGIKGQKHPNFLLPIERLLKRFSIKTSPIAELREQFPDYTLVEIGRLYIDDDYTKQERLAAKKLLFSSMLNIMREVSSDISLSKVIMVLSAGPFGGRAYPKEFGVSPLLKTQLHYEDMIDDVVDGGSEFHGAPIKLSWVDSASTAFDEIWAKEFRNISVFATTGDQVLKKLEENENYFRNFPSMQELLFQTYDSSFDEPL